MEYTACMRVVHPTCETDYGVEGISFLDIGVKLRGPKKDVDD
jgi:hypothetical protein